MFLIEFSVFLQVMKYTTIVYYRKLYKCLNNFSSHTILTQLFTFIK